MIKLQVITGVLLCVFLTLWVNCELNESQERKHVAKTMHDAVRTCSRELEDTKRENAELREWLGVLEREIKTLKRQ